MMRKVILLLASMAAAVLLATGVTLAESTIDQQYTTVDSSEVVYQNQLDAAQTFTAGNLAT